MTSEIESVVKTLGRRMLFVFLSSSFKIFLERQGFQFTFRTHPACFLNVSYFLPDLSLMFLICLFLVKQNTCSIPTRWID